MTLRSRKAIESHIDDSIFGARALAQPLPKYRFPTHENRPEDIYQVVTDELFLDGNARQNLATFCQTWEEPEVHQLMNLAIDKNMIDKTEYPQTAEIEIRCAHMLADLWNAPSAAEFRGNVDHRFVRGLHARRDGGEVALEGAAQGGRQTNRQTEPCLWSGAGMLGQVLPLLGSREARNTDEAGHVSHGSGTDARRCR